YHRSGVHLWCDVMNRASGYCQPCIECPSDHVQSAKDGCSRPVAGDIGCTCAIIGQESGMQIDDALRKLFQECGAQNAHPTCQHDEVDLKQMEEGGQFLFALDLLFPG